MYLKLINILSQKQKLRLISENEKISSEEIYHNYSLLMNILLRKRKAVTIYFNYSIDLAKFYLYLTLNK